MRNVSKRTFACEARKNCPIVKNFTRVFLEKMIGKRLTIHEYVLTMLKLLMPKMLHQGDTHRGARIWRHEVVTRRA